MNKWMSGNKWKFIKYACIGGISALIKFCLFSIFIGFFLAGYKVAATIGFFASAIFHFIANKVITFKNNDPMIFNQILRYSVGAGLNYIATILLLSFFIAEENINHYASMALTILIITVFNFLLSNYWIFKEDINLY